MAFSWFGSPNALDDHDKTLRVFETFVLNPILTLRLLAADRYRAGA
jgi:hypothetical protein